MLYRFPRLVPVRIVGQVMNGNTLRFLLVALTAILCATTASSGYAEDENRVAVHWVGNADLAPIGSPGVLMETFTQIKFEF